MSIFKLALAKKQSRMSREELETAGTSMIRRVRTSDEDRGRYFAEPDIDRKASDFIAKFYESRVIYGRPGAPPNYDYGDQVRLIDDHI